MPALCAAFLLLHALSAAGADTPDAVITVRAGEVIAAVSPYTTGACIEDVNHEIYGGIYSQMLFGESFQEPAPPVPLKDWKAYGGTWEPKDGELWASGAGGPKLIAELPPFAEGTIRLELFLADRSAGNAGLIVNVRDPGLGADSFVGYEISLDAERNVAVLGRHRKNWEHIRDVPCAIPTGAWIPLVVRIEKGLLDVTAGDTRIATYRDEEHPLGPGTIGLRPWSRRAGYRNVTVTTGTDSRGLGFEPVSSTNDGVSGMWRAVRRGAPQGALALVAENPFVGAQSQRIAFEEGEGELGIENRGLNRRGLCVVAERRYEGYVWARAEKPAELRVALENGDGGARYAETTLRVDSPEWRRFDFTLRPSGGDAEARFAFTLGSPGAVVIGHAFLQPGRWGRFKGLPVRRDVVEGLIAQGLTVLRYGGSMVNCPEYRWKNMIGPRDRRPPYKGTWYPYSTNGWGIIDFLDLCEAAGFLAVPAFNMGESPEDMADFVQYVNGSPGSEWGRRRAAGGHRAPYGLTHIQLGNEERVDDAYAAKFEALAEAMWSKDPRVIPVAGDFVYSQPIADPHAFKGAASGITSLAAHERMLKFAKERGKELWFDIHVWTGDPFRLGEVEAAPAYVDALAKVAGGAAHKVVIFEFNANNHAHRRALGNAAALNMLERLGTRLPVICSANCLQPHRQNDNGWDQGLLFLDPARVWPQPPYFVHQMRARAFLPRGVAVEIRGCARALNAAAKTSGGGDALALQVVNLADTAVRARLVLEGFTPAAPTARVTELAGGLDDTNAPGEDPRVAPKERAWTHEAADGCADYMFPPHSFTIIRFE